MVIETPPKPQTRSHRHDESSLQSKCFQKAWNERPETRRLLFTVTNENDRADSNSIQGFRRKQRGVVAGVSDMLMLIPRGCYHGLCLEFKTPTGHQREMQEVWQKLVEFQGYKYVIVRTEEQFDEILDWYLSL